MIDEIMEDELDCIVFGLKKVGTYENGPLESLKFVAEFSLGNKEIHIGGWFIGGQMALQTPEDSK